MKAFFVSITLFALLAGFISWNAVYVTRVSGELSGAADALTMSADEVDALSEKWELHKGYIEISSPASDIHNISDLLETLSVCIRTDDRETFERGKALLANAFEAIAAFESLRPVSIF